MSTSPEPSAWEQRFMSGDPIVLEDFAADVDELSGYVLALMTGEGDWETSARGLLDEIWRGSAGAEMAFAQGCFEASAGIAGERVLPAVEALTALLREKVLNPEFFRF